MEDYLKDFDKWNELKKKMRMMKESEFEDIKNKFKKFLP